MLSLDFLTAENARLKAEVADLRATVNTLREAIKPFADFAEKAETFVGDRAKDGGSPILPSKDFRLSDFRRARAAITKGVA